jgi:hypothetical protein
MSLLLSIILCSLAYASDKYWIAFNGPPKDEPYAGIDTKYLMQIDDLGNIFMPPQKVIKNFRSYVGIAISHRNQNSLNLWMAGTGPAEGGYAISRAVINKRNFQTTVFIKTPFKTMNPRYLQVTQRSNNNFLSSEIFDMTQYVINYVGFGISNFGIPSSTSWLLSNKPTDCDGCGLALSSDGKYLLVSDLVTNTNPNKKKLLIQRLGSNGHPIALPVPLPTGRLTYPLDISDALENGKRYVAYMQDNAGPGIQKTIFLQMIDSDGKAAGQRVQIGYDAVPFQSAAIDPRGHFILYIKRPGPLNLVFQALDSTGQPSGQAKTLVSNVETGIDILRELD